VRGHIRRRHERISGVRNPWPLICSVPVLLYVCGYPLMKRFTRLCHYYLGLALGLAPLCAWLAIRGTIDLPPIVMAGVVLLWTAGFDIIYACQDYASDVATGVFSVPAKVAWQRALDRPADAFGVRGIARRAVAILAAAGADLLWCGGNCRSCCC